MRNSQIFQYFSVLLILGMNSCVMFRPESHGNLEETMPESFSLYGTTIDSDKNRWWEGFESEELDRLVDEALSDNLSLREAWARLFQARATARVAGSALYPDLNLAAEGSGTRQKTKQQGAEEGSTTTVESYALGLASSYELDLWGRVRATRNAASMTSEATREDVLAGAMTLAASVAETWFDVIAQRREQALLARQLDTNKTLLELIELRFRKGIATALDVYQQKQTVAEVEAALPKAQALEVLYLHDLALLLGKSPLVDIQVDATELPELGSLPELGVPADLLANRPDIRAAGLRLKATDWSVSAARADRLPAIRISASAKYNSDEINTIFDNWFANLAGSLTGPLFDAGRRRAEVAKARAEADESLAAYQKRVITAIKEVEDALVSEEKQAEHLAAISREIDVARKAFEQAGQRYLKGANDYLPVLNALLTVQRLEREKIARQTDLLKYRVSLYRALGGTWPEELNPPEETGKLALTEEENDGNK